MKRILWIVFVAMLLLSTAVIAKHGRKDNTDNSKAGGASAEKALAKLQDKKKAELAKASEHAKCVTGCTSTWNACKKKCGTRKTAKKSCLDKCGNDRKQCILKC